MPESAAQIAIRLAQFTGSERVLLITPGRHGEGILNCLLHEWPHAAKAQCVVFDASPERLNAAQATAPEKTRLLQGRATRLPFKRHSFDAILSFEALYAIRPPWTVLAEFHRVLIPSGKFILFEPARHGFFSTLRDKITGPGKRIFALDEIKQRLVRCDYELQQIEEVANVAGMNWPAYCIRAIKLHNAIEPPPEFTTAREMMEKRAKKITNP